MSESRAKFALSPVWRDRIHYFLAALTRRILLWSVIVPLIFGMTRSPEEEWVWLLCMWVSVIPASILAFQQIPMYIKIDPTKRSLQSLTIALIIGFGMLSLQLLRQQVVWSQYLSDKVVIMPGTGEAYSNVRHIMADARVNRGKFIDRTGLVLADTAMVEDGRTARRYPLKNPTAFVSLLGVVSPRYGVSGLEATYEDYLTGNRNSLGRFFQTLNNQPAVGDDVQLTIDARLQQASYELLAGRIGSVVVLDPQSGAILAMASSPSYNPYDLSIDLGADYVADQARMTANWQRLIDPTANQPLLNRAIQGRYPPGSTFKLITAAAVLEHAAITRPDDITCPETFEAEVGAPPIVNAVDNLRNRTGDPASFKTVLAFSCNTAFAQYALRLGPTRFISSAERMGFVLPNRTREAIILRDLPTEASTLFVQPNFLNRPAALADTGYGQGELLVTPLQMAMVTALIANDGVMMQPYLVHRVTRPNGNELYRHRQLAIRRAISANTARTMREAMRYTITDGFGGGAQVGVPANVGGKSGTAEYGAETTHAWFVAIAPIENPRFAVAVILEGGGEGSGVGAQLAGQVLQSAFAYVDQ
ncbi:MAG: peptidoglycan D,D-transpeptidase FtsI family protein [Chloroflexota bacterium]|jgi:peptidoglycan glycosyltransferase